MQVKDKVRIIKCYECGGEFGVKRGAHRRICYDCKAFGFNRPVDYQPSLEEIKRMTVLIRAENYLRMRNEYFEEGEDLDVRKARGRTASPDPSSSSSFEPDEEFHLGLTG